MAPPFHIAADLVTEAVLVAQHDGQAEVYVPARAIITPSARDYLRLHGVTVRRGDAPPSTALPSAATLATTPNTQTPNTGMPIQQVLPPGTEGGLLYQGRCDFPDRAYGCRTEEFGSGFAQTDCCDACAQQGDHTRCSKGDAEFETLVQQLTDEIMARLQGK